MAGIFTPDSLLQNGGKIKNIFCEWFAAWNSMLMSLIVGIIASDSCSWLT